MAGTMRMVECISLKVVFNGNWEDFPDKQFVENSAECVSSHSKKYFIIGYKYFKTQIYSLVIPTFGGIIKGKVKLVRHQRLFVLRQEEKSWM